MHLSMQSKRWLSVLICMSLLMGFFVGLAPTQVRAASAVESPLINGQEVTFQYQGNGSETSVSVAGTINGWSTSANPMVKGAGDVWSVTISNVPFGYQEYKFVVNGDGWIRDPQNALYTKGGNSLLLVADGKELVVVGDAPLSWDTAATSVMTPSVVEDVYQYTIPSVNLSNTTSFKYKILYDPDGSGWDKPIGTGNDNLTITSPVNVTKDVTIYFDMARSELFNTVTDIPIPTVDKADGTTLAPNDTITLSGGTGSLYYTLDGSEPTAASTLYSGPISLTELNGSVTLKSRYVRSGIQGEVGTWTYTVASADTAAPVISSLTPSNGGNASILTNAITLTFNEDVQNLDDSKLSIAPAVGFSATLSERTVTLTLADSLAAGTDYTVSIEAGAVQDMAGNANEAGALSFNTVPSVSAIESPVFNSDGTVTVNYATTASQYFIVGAFNNWNGGSPTAMSLMGSIDDAGTLKNVFSHTFSVADIAGKNGVMEYKLLPGPADSTWSNVHADPLNASPQIEGNSAVHYVTQKAESFQVAIGGTLQLQAARYLADGSQQDLTGDAVWTSDTAGVTVAGGQVTAAADVASGTKANISAAYDGVTHTKEITVVDEILASPVVNGDGTVTFNNNTHSGETLFLVGSMNDWNNSGIAFTKSNGVFSLTKALNPGTYEYKFLVASGSWEGAFTDPLNTKQRSGNSLLIVPGVVISSGNFVEKGSSIQMSAKLVDADGNESNVSPTWSLKTPKAGVSISSGGVLAVASDYDVTANDTVTVVAEHAGHLSEKTIEIKEKLYTYNINYFRYDGQQNNWEMWLWENGKNGTDYDFTGTDVDGFATSSQQFQTNEINLITRLGEWEKKEMDRKISIPEGQEEVTVWIIQDVAEVYYTRDEADISPRVRAALMDSTSTISALTTHELAAEDLAGFALRNATKNQIVPVTATLSGTKKAILTVTDPTLIDVRDLYEVTHPDFSAAEVVMRNILNDSKYFYSGNDLGLTYSAAESTFKMWAPTATQVSVSLYDTAGNYDLQGNVTDHTGGTETVMTRSSEGVWSATISGGLSGKYYMYKVEFADGVVNYAVDPYARAVSANGSRTAILDLNTTDPTNWSSDVKPPMINPQDAILYELHVRDFSIDENSGVTNKGKFLAFTEFGLKDANGNSVGVDHLAELGITHVHLLPSYDFKTVNELTVDDPASNNPKFNWGYDPQNYNVPEGSYSTDPSNPATRINEFKQMVKAMHEKGIRVVMDVVYNHTFEVPNGPFNKIVPGYYYRTDDAGIYTNGSGVGNEVASERPMVRKYIKDSVRYWAEEYNVDGFRFDLMGLIDTTTMTQLTNELKQQVDPTILIYGEPWTGGVPSPLTDQTTHGKQKDKNFAIFNDHFRDAIKGDTNGAIKGFATGAPGKEAEIIKGVQGAINDFANAASESINYASAHDNYNLWDKVLKTQGLHEELGFKEMKDGARVDGGNVEEMVAQANPYELVDPTNAFSNETVRKSLLSNGIVFTSQGIPFIHAGDEILRSKYGDHNSYKSPDIINKIRWEQKETYKPVFDYYQGLIQLRKEHPAFRMSAKTAIEQNLEVFRSDGNVVAFKLKNFANQDTWKNIVVIYNANGTEQTVTMPSDSTTWNVVVNDQQAGTDVITTINGTAVSVPSWSMMVLYDVENAYTPVLTTLDVTSPVTAIEPGGQVLLSAMAKDQRGNAMLGQSPTWSSSDEAIATVNAQGRVTAVGHGEVTLTATIGSVSDSIVLNVGNLIPTTIAISGAASVYATTSITLSAVVKDQFNQPISSTNVSWSSSDPSIATVSVNGVVEGLQVGTVTITASYGGISDTHEVLVKPFVERFIQFQYERPDGDYTGWNLWVWGTGAVNDQILFEEIIDGKAIANVQIAPGVTRPGFIVRKGDWEAKDPAMDRFVEVDVDAVFTKAKLTSGIEEFVITPYLTGPKLNQGDATFFYRDETLFRENRMSEVEAVKLNFNGQQYEMTYDTANEYFSYTVENLAEGSYEYTFSVTKNGTESEFTDPANTVNGKSIIEYVLPNVQVQATIAPGSIHHGQNAVLTVNLGGDAVGIDSITADLTALGGTAQYDIDTELREIAISVLDTVTAGQKNIPIVVTDEYGNKHYGDATVTVSPKLYDDALDFDWDEARIYFILTDRFFNGVAENDDPNGEGYDQSHLETYHGGDFEGLRQKLAYLDELGINTIWITPIVDNIDFNVGQGAPYQYQYGYHGYWAKDFTKIDEHLGDIEDFKNLIEDAHDLGIKIMVDVVLNHSGYGLKENDTNVSNATNFPTDADRARFDGMLRTVPGEGDLTGELSGLPDFITEDPAVRDQIVAWQTAWLDLAKTERGDTIDYFRVDTVKHVDAATLEKFKSELTKLNPDFKMIGEAFNGDIDNQLGFLRSGQMDSLLDFAFKYSAQNFVNGQIDGVEDYLEYRNGEMDNTATMGQFLSSHDEDGFLSEMVGGDESKLKVAAALQITAKGQPVIYYGEELGRSGKTANFNPILGENRGDMPWDQEIAKADLHDHYKKLLNIRDKYSKVFSKGTRNKVAGGTAEEYLFFDRAYEGETVIVGLNVDDAAKSVTLSVPFNEGAIVIDEYSQSVYTVTNGQITVELPARAQGGTVILVEENTDGIDVEAAKQALAIQFADGDSSLSVTQAVYLDTVGINGVSVTWASDKPGTISESGSVTRPAAGEADVVVTMTATLSKGVATDTKTFTLTVKAMPGPTDEELVAAAKAALTIGLASSDTETSVTRDVYLASQGADGVTIAWSSNKMQFIDAEGKVTRPRPGQADAVVTLTATLGKGNVTDTKVFTLTVKALPNSSNTPSAPPQTPPNNPKPGEVIVNNPQAEQGKIPVEIAQGEKKVLLPANAAAIDGKNKLEIKSDVLTTEIPGSVLAELQALIPSEELEGAQVSLEIAPIEEQTKRELLNEVGNKKSATVKAAGDVYDFTLSIVKEDGTVATLSTFKEPITLTFKVDPKANKKRTGVFYISDDNELEYVPAELIGDTYVAQVSHFSKYAVLEMSKTFVDVPATFWAAESIAELASKLIIEGISETEFKPNATVTRAEFAAMLVRALKLSASGQANFQDVSTTAWYAEAVAAASEAGIVHGRTNEIFAPNATITREEMAVMIVRAYAFKTKQSIEANTKQQFADSTSIADWAKDEVQAASQLGFVSGRGNDLFVPKGKATRAESATVILKLLNM